LRYSVTVEIRMEGEPKSLRRMEVCGLIDEFHENVPTFDGIECGLRDLRITMTTEDIQAKILANNLRARGIVAGPDPPTDPEMDRKAWVEVVASLARYGIDPKNYSAYPRHLQYLIESVKFFLRGRCRTPGRMLELSTVLEAAHAAATGKMPEEEKPDGDV
jgi:hypothetical protein